MAKLRAKQSKSRGFGYPAFWARTTWISRLLTPLSWLYRACVTVRLSWYHRGWLKSVRLPLPVIVVGNISVGGTGKSPLVLWLAARLRAAGYQPGIVSRGYKGKAKKPRAVHAGSDAIEYGDEPVLLARDSGCPVWIGKDRAAAAQALLEANPACNIIISDDGLQHYRLARDVEIAVVDGTRGHGNGKLLPAGPLREPVARLDSVDAVVVRGLAPDALMNTLRAAFTMTLEPAKLRNLHETNRTLAFKSLKDKRVHAVAGIGHPQQFFDSLTQLGIAHVPHAYADHHKFKSADITFENCDAVVMTEKDAVKCECFATNDHWALQTEARIHKSLLQRVVDRMKNPAPH